MTLYSMFLMKSFGWRFTEKEIFVGQVTNNGGKNSYSRPMSALRFGWSANQ
jgi:hypothetical protein